MQATSSDARRRKKIEEEEESEADGTKYKAPFRSKGSVIQLVGGGGTERCKDQTILAWATFFVLVLVTRTERRIGGIGRGVLGWVVVVVCAARAMAGTTVLVVSV
jgi:hypothetical protein